MKSFVVAAFVAVIFQVATSQVIRSCGPNIYQPILSGPVLAPSIVAPPCAPISPCAPTVIKSSPVIASVVPSNSVANSLADTLSLLTVSSLLAETLPLSVPVVPVASGCGCGYPAYYI